MSLQDWGKLSAREFWDREGKLYQESQSKKRRGDFIFGLHKETGEPYHYDSKKLQRHLYIIGESGCGKSKFIEALLEQEIALGNGFGVIDPTADLVEHMKGHIAAIYHRTQDEELLNRVILVDPTHPTLTVTFNPLEALPNTSAAQQAAELVTIFHKIWADSWGTRMEDVMRNSFIALCEAGCTLPDLLPFFGDANFRAQIMERVSHPIVRRYFEEEFDRYTPAARTQVVAPIRNKLRAFLADDRVRQMLSSPKSSFNFREAMDTRKIMLISLDDGQLKDSAYLLGSLFMSKIKMAAHSRTDTLESQRVPFRLYVDEFENFASEDFAITLAQSRKYALSLVIAHQDFTQISTQLRGAVLSNAATRVSFRVDYSDSHHIANEFFQYSENEVKNTRVNQSGEHSYAYRSSGEQRERLAQDIQHLPDRTLYVNDKLARDTTRITTSNVTLPADALGMTEWEAKEYIAQVPIGRKYLVERQAIEDEAIARAQPEPGSQLTADEEAIILFISDNTLKVTQLYKALNIATAKGTRLKKEMQAKGYVDELTVQLNPLGAPSKILLPCDKALKLLGQELPRGRGSPLHRNIQQLVAQLGRARGYRVRDNDIEKNLSNGGIVDVHLEKDGERIAVEVAITSTPGREISHITNCLADGYDKVVSLFLNETSLETARARLNEFSEQERARVILLPLKQLAQFL